MLFHEIYGSYYRTVSEILKESVDGTLDRRHMDDLVRKHAFGESFLSIPEGLTGEQWRLLHKDLSTPLMNEPVMPLTLLEKRWMKALLLDPRIRLFDPDTSGLEDVEPLFTPDMFVWYDRYTNGDDFLDGEYIRRFRIILCAMREQKDLLIRYESRRGFIRSVLVSPRYLEYSEKDDRFRLCAAGKRLWILNLSQILDCYMMDERTPMLLPPAEKQTIRFELEDERNALERVLLHFSHLEKETKRLDEKHYRVTLVYDRNDEMEMVIRLLSFGPMIRVTEPESMIRLVCERIEQQRKLTGGCQ